MSRLPGLTAAERDAVQQALFERITGGARARSDRDFGLVDAQGALRGPFNAMLYSPEIGDAVQQLGALLRFSSSLPAELREVAILTVGQHWRADFEWYAHALIAKREGLEDHVIDAIKNGQTPDTGDDIATVHRFASELLRQHRVSAETYRAATDLLGERSVVDLVFLVGYYTFIAGTLNAFEVPVPEGAEAPFTD
ncbi:MAG: carboxymuconolactone decarboxylase family protein [Methyloligellaceae bacterium]